MAWILDTVNSLARLVVSPGADRAERGTKVGADVTRVATLTGSPLHGGPRAAMLRQIHAERLLEESEEALARATGEEERLQLLATVHAHKRALEEREREYLEAGEERALEIENAFLNQIRQNLEKSSLKRRHRLDAPIHTTSALNFIGHLRGCAPNPWYTLLGLATEEQLLSRWVPLGGSIEPRRIYLRVYEVDAEWQVYDVHPDAVPDLFTSYGGNSYQDTHLTETGFYVKHETYPGTPTFWMQPNHVIDNTSILELCALLFIGPAVAGGQAHYYIITRDLTAQGYVCYKKYRGASPAEAAEMQLAKERTRYYLARRNITHPDFFDQNLFYRPGERFAKTIDWDGFMFYDTQAPLPPSESELVDNATYVARGLDKIDYATYGPPGRVDRTHYKGLF